MNFTHHLGPDPFKIGSPSMPPRAWWRPTANMEYFREFIAYVSCKNGHVCMLSRRNHTVSSTGEVAPSLVCPTKGCDGHDVGVVLEGWSDPPDAHRS